MSEKITIYDCPECGSAMEAESPVYDGDTATCEDCGYTAGVSVDEDGSMWLQD